MAHQAGSDASSANKLKSLAFHEAGHAIIARHFGRTVHSVWIDQGTKDGKTETSGGVGPKDGGLDEEEIIILLAGGRAEFQFNPNLKSSSVAGLKDESEISTMIYEYLRTRDGPFTNTDDEEAKIRDRLAQKTKDLVAQPKMWAEITAVAMKLIEKLKIEKNELEAVIQSVAAAGI